VLVKLLLTTFATFLLLLHTRPIDQVASIAMRTALASTDLRPLRLQLIGDASAALFVLLMTSTLSVYKPWGMTLYGVRNAVRGSASMAAVNHQSHKTLRPPRFHCAPRIPVVDRPLARCRDGSPRALRRLDFAQTRRMTSTSPARRIVQRTSARDLLCYETLMCYSSLSGTTGSTPI
jgi:hypothetical protein